MPHILQGPRLSLVKAMGPPWALKCDLGGPNEMKSMLAAPDLGRKASTQTHT